MAWTKKTFINPPRMKQPAALTLFIVNIFFPGVGTIISSLLAFSMENLIIGIVQTLTTAIIIGYVWSIWWGWALLQKSKTQQIDEATDLLDPHTLKATSDPAWNKKTFFDPPTLNKGVAFILFVVNLIFPGVGTIIAAVPTCNLENLIVGVIQLVTAPIIIGWIWSIMWGWELLQEARRTKMPAMDGGELGPDSAI